MADHAPPPAADLVVDLQEDAPQPPAAPAAAAPPGEAIVELPEDGATEAAALPAHAVPLPDGRVRLPLLHPVTLNIKRGETVRQEVFAELVLRRMNGADLRAVEAAGKNAYVVSLQRASGISAMKFDALFDRMDAADIAAASDVMGFFLQRGRKTGR